MTDASGEEVTLEQPISVDLSQTRSGSFDVLTFVVRDSVPIFVAFGNDFWYQASMTGLQLTDGSVDEMTAAFS